MANGAYFNCWKHWWWLVYLQKACNIEEIRARIRSVHRQRGRIGVATIPFKQGSFRRKEEKENNYG
ncbi:MAG: hypothetical protein K9K75_00955 [Deltaproteobacteria bacterium]|nr:hypothetical protein [Deltaproteobacteria bacterium]